MVKLVFVCGPNGVGKSTACREMLQRLPDSSLVDSEWCRAMNPYTHTPDRMKINEANIVSLLRNYIGSNLFRYVIWTYGFHGARRSIFDAVMRSIADLDHEFTPFCLTCDLHENIRRMKKDGRDQQRIERALATTRSIYGATPYEKVDTTMLTIDEVADAVISRLLP